jgi:hypothetical protein
MAALHRHAALLFLVFTACPGGDQPSSNAIWQLTQQTLSDTCAPPRANGEIGHVGLITSTKTSLMTVTLRDGDTAVKGDLIQLEAPADRTVPIPGCAGASLHLVARVDKRESAAVEVNFVRDFAGLEGCSGLQAPLPQKSCRVEQRLSYQRLVACGEQCQLGTLPDEGGQLRLECRCGR